MHSSSKYCRWINARSTLCRLKSDNKSWLSEPRWEYGSVYSRLTACRHYGINYSTQSLRPAECVDDGREMPNRPPIVARTRHGLQAFGALPAEVPQQILSTRDCCKRKWEPTLLTAEAVGSQIEMSRPLWYTSSFPESRSQQY